jgi:Ca2+-binding EF-hand superfamily protein
MYRGIDIDGTGSVHYIEFLAATLEAVGSIDEERLAEAFDRIDCDDTGYISIENCMCSLLVELRSETGDVANTAVFSHVDSARFSWQRRSVRGASKDH